MRHFGTEHMKRIAVGLGILFALTASVAKRRNLQRMRLGHPVNW